MFGTPISIFIFQAYTSCSSLDLFMLSIPIGYWSIPLTSSDTNQTTSVGPYIPGAWPFFLQALTWAQSHSINVIVDLHGAPGSQNGFDNSGQRTNNPVWGSNPANVSRTLDIIRFLAKNVGDRVAVIELLNEPAGFTSGEFADAVRGYWSDGYDAVRSEAGGAVKVMIGDAFLGVSVRILITKTRIWRIHGLLLGLARFPYVSVCSGCYYGLCQSALFMDNRMVID